MKLRLGYSTVHRLFRSSILRFQTFKGEVRPIGIATDEAVATKRNSNGTVAEFCMPPLTCFVDTLNDKMGAGSSLEARELRTRAQLPEKAAVRDRSKASLLVLETKGRRRF